MVAGSEPLHNGDSNLVLLEPRESEGGDRTVEATPTTALTETMAGQVPVTQLDQASSSGGGRGEGPKQWQQGPETLAKSRPESGPFNPYYGSFSLD